MNQLSQQCAGKYDQSAAPSVNQLSQQGAGEYHQSAAPAMNQLSHQGAVSIISLQPQL